MNCERFNTGIFLTYVMSGTTHGNQIDEYALVAVILVEANGGDQEFFRFLVIPLLTLLNHSPFLVVRQIFHKPFIPQEITHSIRVPVVYKESVYEEEVSINNNVTSTSVSY